MVWTGVFSKRREGINMFYFEPTTIDNYATLGQTITELFGKEILIKIGFALDESLPDNHKDIMVFIAGN